MPIRSVQAKWKRLRRHKALPIKLPFPLSPTLRVAQLANSPKFENVRALMVEHWKDIQLCAPNVVIGSSHDLRRLAEECGAEDCDTSFLDHALVTLTHYGDKPLSDLLRVMLWQAFGVPIFELYLGLDNALLAAECEAHHGWHLAPGVTFSLLDDRELILDGAGNNGLHTGLRAMLDPSTCPCGRPSMRLLEIERLGDYEPYLVAASA